MQKRSIRLTILVAGLLAVVIPGLLIATAQPITGCEPIGDADPLCGWTNPEDMVALPDGRHVKRLDQGALSTRSFLPSSARVSRWEPAPLAMPSSRWIRTR